MNENDIDKHLSGMSPAQQIAFLRKALLAQSSVTTYYCDLVTSVRERWEPLVEAAERAWLADRIQANAQDVRHDAQVFLRARRPNSDPSKPQDPGGQDSGDSRPSGDGVLS